MIKHVIAKSIGRNGIVQVIILKGIPVVRKLLRTKNKHGLVSILIVLNDCQSSKGFTKTYAIRKNAAVELLKLVDNGKNCISLEVIKHTPNLAFLESGRLIRKNVL